MDQASTLRLLMRERSRAEDAPGFSVSALARHADHVVSFVSTLGGGGNTELIGGIRDGLLEQGHSAAVLDPSAGCLLPDSRPDFLLVVSGGASQEYHSSRIRNVVLLTPESVRRTLVVLRALKNECGLERVDVIVNDVTDPAIARKTFLDLSSDAKIRIGMNLQFLGHCFLRNFGGHGNRRSLLDWNEHATRACLRLIAKRVSGEKA